MLEKLGIFFIAIGIAKFIYAMYLKRKRQIICWIENHLKKIDNYIEN